MEKVPTLRPKEREIIIDAAGINFRGKRTNNEDSFFANEYWLDAQEMKQNRVIEQKRKLKKGTYGVFDGVGGDRHGEVAACAAAQFFSYNSDCIGDQLQISETSNAVFKQANKAVLKAASGSCCTATVLGISELTASIAYVGDSSAFFMRDGILSCLTIAHKPATDCNGTFQANHTINRYLGEVDEAKLYIPSVCPGIPLIHNDLFLLCSDGVTDVLDTEMLSELLRASIQPKQLAERIVRSAYIAGSGDNITALILKIQLV